MPSSSPLTTTTRASLTELVRYFLYLGTFGFGGPVALIGFMHRDLVERRRWIDEDEYRLGVALAQIMPGPLAAQLAIALGYFQRGVLGATAVGLAFVVPSFLMVIGISIAYRRFGGLWWMQALFYGIGAAVIAIIAIAAYKLARSTNKRDPLLWAVFGALVLVTMWAEAELAEVFVIAGLVTLFARARPTRAQALTAGLGGAAVVAGIWLIERWFINLKVGGEQVLLQIFVFFTKAGAFVFGSGLAIVPFLHQGVVQQFGWLNEQQFIDAVAVAMITPGPVVITVVFIGFLAAGLLGAVAAAIGIFLPVYLFTIIPAPWFSRNRDNALLKAFVLGATSAATGAIAGAVILLARRAIYDVPTAAVALISFGVLWRFKVPEPILVAAAGIVGLIAFPFFKS
ncbi:MAG TPA: chromate efflux transporter [Methylomirabilota bacterium]|jgi:chromate transporter|nr:chromate efflux transporter [Methylomirabilota bacterium]